MQEKGAEFGATTGRPRRCGWLDMVVVRYAVRFSGITGLCVTKLDVLTGLEKLQVCVAYEDPEGKRYESMPASLEVLAGLKPVYEEHPGWNEDISGARTWDELPANCQSYLNRMSELAGAPLSIVSVGAGREQTIVM
jgi:adenylosuccinate synthase